METSQNTIERLAATDGSAGWYPWHRDGKTIMRKIYTKAGKDFIKLKLLPAANVRKLARLMGVKPTPPKSKRTWVMMEVTPTTETKQQTMIR